MIAPCAMVPPSPSPMARASPATEEGCRLQATPGAWRLESHDAAAEEIFACSEEITRYQIRSGQRRVGTPLDNAWGARGRVVSDERCRDAPRY